MLRKRKNGQPTSVPYNNDNQSIPDGWQQKGDTSILTHRKIMKLFQITGVTALLRVLLFTGGSVAAFFAVAPAAPLRIGDDAGGGKVAYILQQGDVGYLDTPEQTMIAAKVDITGHLFWADSKIACEKLPCPGYISALPEGFLRNKEKEIAGSASKSRSVETARLATGLNQ